MKNNSVIYNNNIFISFKQFEKSSFYNENKIMDFINKMKKENKLESIANLAINSLIDELNFSESENIKNLNIIDKKLTEESIERRYKYHLDIEFEFQYKGILLPFVLISEGMIEQEENEELNIDGEVNIFLNDDKVGSDEKISQIYTNSEDKAYNLVEAFFKNDF